MNVAIMTWFRYHNYGTALQAVALNNTLKSHGFTPWLIDYHNENRPENLPEKMIITEYTQKVIKKLMGRKSVIYTNTEREQKFKAFFDENVKLTKEVEDLVNLESLNNEIQAFICGSDQIWAPSVFDPHYYLDFVYDDNRKIAYAPSVGLRKLDNPILSDAIKTLASKIRYISTREKQGSNQIEKLIGRNVETVIDPTLLMNREQWKQEASQYADTFRPYILVYMLGKKEKYWRDIYLISKKLKLEVKIIPVFEKDLNRKGCICDAIGPRDFLSLIANAQYVCTDSFHGMAFAINFSKPFSVFDRFGKYDRNNQNSRIENLLEILDLQNRRVINGASLTSINLDVAYEDVQQRLENERNKSLKFLLTALREIGDMPQEKKQVRIDEQSLCCGCGVCAAACPQNAIKISLDRFGFFRAVIDKNVCISCGKCLSVCPYKQKKLVDIKDAECYSFISTDQETLSKSSSGGFSHWIAKNAVENNQFVYGCAFNCSERRAEHIITRTVKEVELLQGSKYMQSDFASNLQKLIDEKTSGIVIGLPCEIAGAKNLFGKRKDILFIDLICHGIPSYNVFVKYREILVRKEFSDDDIIDTKFRFKQKGWRTRYICNKANEKEYYKKYSKDEYARVFEEGFCNSNSCFECQWREQSAADIRIGDYWHTKYANNNTGISMVLAITEKGREIISQIEKSEAVVKKEPVEDYFECQQTKNSRRPVFWEKLQLELLSNKDLGKIVDKYFLPFERRKRINKKLRKLLGRFI